LTTRLKAGGIIVEERASIVGVVQDTSNAVMPGVTVEAASPALIEKTRAVVSDEHGEYKIVDLRPGSSFVEVLLAPGYEDMPEFLAGHNVEVIASPGRELGDVAQFVACEAVFAGKEGIEFGAKCCATGVIPGEGWP